MKIKSDLLSRPRVKSYGYLHLSHHRRLWRNRGKYRMSSNKYCTTILESLVTAFIQCYEALLELFGGHGEICMKCMIQLRGPEVITGRDRATDVKLQHILHIDTALRKGGGV